MIRVFRRHLYHDRPEQAYCSKGTRQFFHRHGLDWVSFVRSGIDADVLLRLNDAMATRAVRNAERELNCGQQ